MKLGMILPRTGPGGRSLTGPAFVESARRLERLGFHSGWLTDSMNRGFPSPDPLVALGAAAATTDRLHLGTSILQIAIREPVDLANRVMATHLLAGDRLSIGVGAGSTLADFEATGTPFEDRFRRFARAVDVLPRLWAGQTVDGACLTPFGTTLGGPELLIGSWGGSRWIPRAAREFDGWIASARHSTWGQIEDGIRRYRDHGGTRAVLTNLIVDLERTTAQPSGDTPSPAGSRDLRDVLARVRDLGFDEVVLRIWAHSEETVGRVRELATDA